MENTLQPMDIDTDNQDGTTIRVGSPPPGAASETIHATLFAPAYRSIFTIGDRNAKPSKKDIECLAHVNCSYLSTKGRAPTLLELKRHAQSLTVLIKNISISTKSGIVDNHNLKGLPADSAFNQNESYDWLNNLNQPYNTDDRHHTMPLTSLMNTIEPVPESDTLSMGHNRDICALYDLHSDPERKDLAEKHLSQPYATHNNLLKHANEILEYLDHEYSAKGGLSAILPSAQDDPEQRKWAESTLLGQFILFNQRMVQRLHDLERLYADAMDVLAGEANSPHQILSRLGPDGRKPRDVVYPQDRFVLVNAGDDVWQYLHDEFNRKEITDVAVDETYKSHGLTGERLWEKRGGAEFARGITAIDVVTRYYRLRDDPLKTIFMIPAYQTHPGTKVTRELMRQPTIVSVVKPLWPERISVWEQKHRAELKRLKDFERTHQFVEQDKEDLQQQIDFLKRENDMLNETNKTLEVKKLHPSQMAAQQRLDEQLTQINKMRNDARDARANAEFVITAHKNVEDATKRALDAAERERERTNKDIAEREKELQERELQTHNRELDVACAARETHERLTKVWGTQLAETLALHEFLKSRMPEGQTIPQATRDNAKAMAEEMMKTAPPAPV